MKILLFANTDWYLYNFRISLADAIRKAKHDAVLVSPPGKYGKIMLSQGFNWKTIALKRGKINILAELKSIIDLVILYKNEKPDIVHHFTMKAVVYGMIAAKLAGIKKSVNAVAGLGIAFSNNTRPMKLVRFVILILLKVLLTGKHTQVIVQNPDDQLLFMTYRLISNDRIHLIRGSGVNIERFIPNRAEKIEKNGCVVILLASRMLWDKGVGLFVETARRMRSEGHILFLLAGTPDSGNPNSISMDDLMHWQREKNIRYLGHVEEIDKILAISDIVTLPTVYGEGVPRILIEAAAAGLPIVATDVPGCREIVNHRENGLLISPGDEEELTEAILLLSKDPILREKMGKNSRQLVVKERFDQMSVINDTMQIYSIVSG